MIYTYLPLYSNFQLADLSCLLNLISYSLSREIIRDFVVPLFDKMRTRSVLSLALLVGGMARGVSPAVQSVFAAPRISEQNRICNVTEQYERIFGILQPTCAANEALDHTYGKSVSVNCYMFNRRVSIFWPYSSAF